MFPGSWIAGVEQASVPDEIVDFVGDDAGLDGHGEVVVVDFAHAAHLFERQHDAAVDRNGSARKPASRTAGCDGMRTRFASLTITATAEVDWGVTTTSGMWPYSSLEVSSWENPRCGRDRGGHSARRRCG